LYLFLAISCILQLLFFEGIGKFEDIEQYKNDRL